MRIKISVALILFLVVTVAVLYYQAGNPLYEVGMVRKAFPTTIVDVPPTPSSDENSWQVEPGIRLHHFSKGTGHDVLVVHGGPGYPFIEPISAFDPLTDRYRFVYYDQRGCGRSTKPISSFPPASFYKNLVSLNDRLGLQAQIADIERIRLISRQDKLTIIGHSFGAFIAAMYAAEFPDRIRALVLNAPADVLVFPATGGGIFTQIHDRLPEEFRADYARFQSRYLNFKDIFSKTEQDLQRLNAQFAGYYLTATGALTEPAAALEGDLAAQPGWMVQAIYLSMGKRHDYREPLKSVTAPVLILHGAKDMQPESASRSYADLFPNSEFHTIPNAGHQSFRQSPHVFADLTGSFLDKHIPRSARGKHKGS